MSFAEHNNMVKTLSTAPADRKGSHPLMNNENDCAAS